MLSVGGSRPAAVLFISSKPLGQILLGCHVRELGIGWNLRWIAADHTRETCLEQGMEPWITHDNDLKEVRLQIPDKSEDPQVVSQLPCCGKHKNTVAAHFWA